MPTFKPGNGSGVISRMYADRSESNDQISKATMQALRDQFGVDEVRAVSDDFPLYFVSQDGRVFSRKPVGSDVQRKLNDPKRKWRELRLQDKYYMSIYHATGGQKRINVSTLLEWAGWT